MWLEAAFQAVIEDKLSLGDFNLNHLFSFFALFRCVLNSIWCMRCKDMY